MSVDLDGVRPQLAAVCQRYGLTELSVFGSVARDEGSPTSDVDLLYVVAPGHVLRLDDREALVEELEALLGHEVDLVPKRYLHRVLRPRVLAEARVLYGRLMARAPRRPAGSVPTRERAVKEGNPGDVARNGR